MKDGGVRSVCCVEGCEMIARKRIVRPDEMGDKKEMGAVARVIAVSLSRRWKPTSCLMPR